MRRLPDAVVSISPKASPILPSVRRKFGCARLLMRARSATHCECLVRRQQRLGGIQNWSMRHRLAQVSPRATAFICSRKSLSLQLFTSPISHSCLLHRRRSAKFRALLYALDLVEEIIHQLFRASKLQGRPKSTSGLLAFAIIKRLTPQRG